MATTDHATAPKRRQSGPWQRFWRTVGLTGLIVTGGLVGMRFLGLFEGWEIAVYDRWIQLQPAAPLDDRLLVIGISETDIQSREEYPIQEGTVVKLIETLEQYGPRVIALDFALDFPQGSAAERQALTELLASRDRIVSACLMSSEQFPGVPPAPGIAPDLVAFADFPEDADGVIRRSLLVSTPSEMFIDEVVRSHLCNEPGAELLSLSFLLALIYLEDEGIFPEQTDAGWVRWQETVVPQLSRWWGGYANLGAVDYQTMLNYRAPRNAVRQVSLTEVLADQVNPDWIRDRVVLVGYTSPVVNDIFTTPYRETTPGFRGMAGVVLHAQATSQLLSAVLDGRPLIWSWPEAAEIALIAVCSLLGGTLVYGSGRVSVQLLGLMGAVVLLVGASYGLFLQGLWLPVVPMTVAMVGAAIAVGLVRQAQQSVYAQAIFEQLKAEMTGQIAQQSGPSGRDRVTELVQRAQAIRRRQAIGTLMEEGDMTQFQQDPMHMEFDSPEVQTFYEQIKAHLQRQFKQEKATLEHPPAAAPASKSARLTALLNRAQQTRNPPSTSPSQPQSDAQSQSSSASQ